MNQKLIIISQKQLKLLRTLMDCHLISVIVNNSHSWESTILTESSPKKPCDLAAGTPGQRRVVSARESITMNATKQFRSTALKIICAERSQALSHNQKKISSVGLPPVWSPVVPERHWAQPCLCIECDGLTRQEAGNPSKPLTQWLQQTPRRNDRIKSF